MVVQVIPFGDVELAIVGEGMVEFRGVDVEHEVFFGVAEAC